VARWREYTVLWRVLKEVASTLHGWRKAPILRTIRERSVPLQRQDSLILERERPYRTVSRRYVWRSAWYNVRQDELEAADGSAAVYTVVEKPGGVWIVPLTDGGDLVLIEQYRYPVDDWCLEVPAGNIEQGVPPEVMAARELAEEVGGLAREWVPVGRFYSLNGICDQVAHVYVALGVTLARPNHEPTEHISVRLLPVNDALHMAASGAINDGPSALALLLSERVLRAHLGEGEA